MAFARKVYVTTATGGLATRSAPVGGGVAVLEALVPYLAARPDLEVVLVRPGAVDRCELRMEAVGAVTEIELAVPALAGGDPAVLLELDERAYARFALDFERALGRFFAARAPRAGEAALVLANDVSEGPPFAELAALGFAQVVLYHVVVGEFFARQYLPLGGRPGVARAAAGLWRAAERSGLARFAPELARLVWTKEAAAARHAHAVVPSPASARALAELYPASGVAARTAVVPWGVLAGPAAERGPDPARRARRAETLRTLGVDPGRFVLTALSRLSREKRLELALAALARLERADPACARRLALTIAGAPAYMGGEACARELERRARRLELVDVHFLGYVVGERKWDLLAASDLFLSTSSYEAYGLGIAQALASGTPAVATAHAGAEAIFAGSDGAAPGWIVRPSARSLGAAIQSAAGADLALARHAAAAWGATRGFEHAARAVAEVVERALAARPAAP